MFKTVKAAQSCGQKAVGTFHSSEQTTGCWTTAMREAVRLKKLVWITGLLIGISRQVSGGHQDCSFCGSVNPRFKRSDVV